MLYPAIILAKDTDYVEALLPDFSGNIIKSKSIDDLCEEAQKYVDNLVEEAGLSVPDPTSGDKLSNSCNKHGDLVWLEIDINNYPEINYKIQKNTP